MRLVFLCKKYICTTLLSALILLCFGNKSIAQTLVQYINVGTFTWTPPAGCTSWYAEGWGGGAGGNVNYGGGGAGYTKTTMQNVSGNASAITIVVGSGGCYGGNGGESSIKGIPCPGGVGNGGTPYYYNPDAEIAICKTGGWGGTTATHFICSKGYGGGGGSASSSADGGSGGNGSSTFISGCIVTQGSGGSGVGVGGNGLSLSNTQPGGGSGAGPSGSCGSAGQVNLLYYCQGNGGTIASPKGDHTVPSPQEQSETINNVTLANGQQTGMTYQWVLSTNGGANWSDIGGQTGINLTALPTMTVETWFMRKANTCGGWLNSNIVKIKVFSNTNISNGTPSLNGQIIGYVKNKTKTAGVPGITVTALKTSVSLKGSPQSKVYTTTTDANGKYTFNNIFYGDKNAPCSDPTPVSFTITPSKLNHKFNKENETKNLSYDLYQANWQPGDEPNFLDTTVVVVSGKVYQQCQGCLDGSNNPVNTITAGRYGATLTGGDLPSYPDTITGNYSTTIADLGSRTFTPSYKNHVFTPASKTGDIQDNVSTGYDFEDTKTFTISGKLTDGAGDSIGTAVLEFRDTIPGKNIANPVFRKTTNVAADGTYSVTLPARSYNVKINSFTSNYVDGNPRYLTGTEVGTFFNSLVRKDSLYRNIDTANAVLNLVYHRAPVLQIVGLVDTACNANVGVVFTQNVPKTFTVNVFEGDPLVIGFKMVTLDKIQAPDSLSVGDSVKIWTDILDKTGTAPPAYIKHRLIKGADTATLVPGVPNTVAPFQKQFQVLYTDRYGRVATPITRKAVVIGIQSPPQTFVTTAPDRPSIILHRPPGDLSTSFIESTSTCTTTERYSVNMGGNLKVWDEVKVGAAFSSGVGVEIETKVEGSVNASITTTVTNNKNNEATITNTAVQRYTTKSSDIVGTGGDVFIGGAMNYKYGISNVVEFDADCQLKLKEKLIIAPAGFATTFTYSEDHIKNTLMPSIKYFIDHTTGAEQDKYKISLKSWQDVLANNDKNKQNAKFIKNLSFDGGAGPIDESTINSITDVNTTETSIEINDVVAGQLKIEVNGTGGGGGVTVGFKVEQGRSSTNTQITQTANGYRLMDNDMGDYYSVDVKRDPVYGTYVYDLVAGTASCPPEPGAQNRDNPQIILNTPVYNNVAKDSLLAIDLYLVNKSESREARNYLMDIDNSTSNRLTIYKDGVPLGSTVNIPVNNLAYLLPRVFTIGVKKTFPNDSLCTFPNIRVILKDACGGRISSDNSFTINYVSPCGGISLANPADDFVNTSLDNNILPVTFTGYTPGSIKKVELEYAPVGSNNWVTGFTKQIISDPTSTTVPWDITGLPDSLFKLRLKMECLSGAVVYTPYVKGLIDRKSPIQLGNAQPADQDYVKGDEISFTYNENISTSGLNNKVEMRLISNNIVIPATVSGAGAKIVIVPLVDLTTYPLDSVRVIVTGISDIYGNVKSVPDTSYFAVGKTVAQATTLDTVKIYIVTPSMLENANGKMEVHFKLNSKRKELTKVYFTVSGTAIFNDDYTVSSDTLQKKVAAPSVLIPGYVFQPVYNYFDGASGFIYIDSAASEAVLKIDPVGDTKFEANETIIINLLSGGSYSLTDSVSTTSTIINDDINLPIITAVPSLSICGGDSVILTASATQKGNAVQFDGVSQQVDLAPLSVTSNTMTFECWAYANGSQNSAAGLVFARGAETPASGIGFAYLDPGKLGYNWNDDGASYNWTGGPAYPLNTWFHTALVVEADKATLYLNGVPYVNNVTHLPVTFADITQLAIDNCCADRKFNGKMDEVRIWNVARTKAEIVASMNASVPTNSPGLMAYYKFEEEGSIVKDATANGKSGTLENGTTRVVSDAGAVPYTSFLWSNGGATTPSIVVKNSGAYAVTVGDGSGNTATTSSVNVSLTPAPTVNAGTALVDVCPGTASVSLGGSFGGGATGAVWSDNGAGGTFNNNTGATPNTATYSPAASANGNLVLTITSTGVSCTATANKQIFVNGQSTWLGITGDWNLGSNWSNGVEPISCTKVIIPQSVTNMPTITGTNNSCYRVDLQPGARLNVATGATLLITGH